MCSFELHRCFQEREKWEGSRERDGEKSWLEECKGNVSVDQNAMKPKSFATSLLPPPPLFPLRPSVGERHWSDSVSRPAKPIGGKIYMYMYYLIRYSILFTRVAEIPRYISPGRKQRPRFARTIPRTQTQPRTMSHGCVVIRQNSHEIRSGIALAEQGN